MSQSNELFKSSIVPAPSVSGKLFEERLDAPGGPVVCLGKTFASEEERRAYFTAELRKRLRDPEFRKTEGFPIGEDEDILALSDPPYYTACPNPWLEDFINEWESEKGESGAYHREPFAADVSEGKNDPIYNAHSYHTKVPHKAIMRYILHYTEPGDIVFDGFCGTGMTGVAAQMCGNKAEVESLGYKVEDDGTILQEENNQEDHTVWKPFSRLGARKAALNDLSPAATFIAYNYNTPVDAAAFEKEAKRILAEVEAECGWMYETLHSDGKTKGKINYTVWSEVFSCPQCSKEVVFWEAAFDKEAGKVKDEFPCPHCGAMLNKRRMDRAWVTKFDSAINKTIKQAKRVPVLINYTVAAIGEHNKKLEKTPDKNDLALIAKIEGMEIPYWFPTNKIPKGDKTGDPIRAGITNAHHFYTKRNLWILSSLWHKFGCNHRAKLAITSILMKTASLLHNIGLKNGNINLAGALPNAMYVPSNLAERNLFILLNGKIDDMIRTSLDRIRMHQVLSVASLSSLFQTNINNSNVDYIFIDPPFGSNLQYSELNSIWESWLAVFTNNKEEAVESRIQNKKLDDYRLLMINCFKECYNIIKPGHWMTVEFSNTSSAIWNTIQSSLTSAGFIVGNVSALDKGQGTFNSQTNLTSVKQDLVISAYKPNGGFEERFIKEADTEEGVWDFIRTHFRYLPAVKIKNNEMQFIPERDPRILFDHVIAYYVRKGVTIPIASSQEFQAGLKKRFDERDGMYFLHEQAVEYDRKKLTTGGIKQPELFVLNEETAIQWLKSLLDREPQTMQDIHPRFMQELTGWDKKEKQLELRTLLEENFIEDELGKWRVPDPENAAHIEKIREKALLREFEEYKNAAKRLKVFRVEAVRAGFKKAYNDRDYETIIKVAGRLQGDIIEEDPKLLMWYSNAQTRLGED